MKALDEQAVKMVQYRRSIRALIRDFWGLEAQIPKPEFQEAWDTVLMATGRTWERKKDEVKAEWFGDYNKATGEWEWYGFVKGKHYTWQQALILVGIEKAMSGGVPRKISVVSGHGIGKSATCSWIVLWFLYCFYDSQVPVTAPTSSQMHDVLWKELAKWISKIQDDAVRELYEWQHDYVRMNYSPETWFARARTSSKENTEAIAGVHSDHVAIVIDEASGVPEQVFTTAQGALTSGNVLLVMISNGTRTIGYFHDSHHRNKEDFQTFRFDSEQSPIVDKQYVGDMEKQHGRGSEEFKIRVSGGFPGEDIMDDSGYLQLIPMTRVHVRLKDELGDTVFLGQKILGLDPSGEGKDKATFVVRDRFKAEKVFERQTTNPRQLAEDTLTLIDRYNLDPRDVVIGAFGVGTDIGKEIALATAKFKKPYEVYTVLEGNHPDDEEEYNGKFFQRLPDELTNPDGATDQWTDLYLNLRALMYFRAKKWLFGGGEVVDVSVENSEFANELVTIRYKRTLHGNKIQLMSKKEMLKLRIKSPNIGDAFGLTFLRNLDDVVRLTEDEREAAAAEERMTDDERHSSI